MEKEKAVQKSIRRIHSAESSLWLMDRGKSRDEKKEDKKEAKATAPSGPASGRELFSPGWDAWKFRKESGKKLVDSHNAFVRRLAIKREKAKK